MALHLELADLPDGFRVPVSSYWQLLSPEQVSDSGFWEFYIDGSTSDTRAAWALVCCWSDGKASTLVGSLAAEVAISPDSADWIGAETVDNIAAELTAMTWASLIALRWSRSASVVIRPDLSLSRLISQGSTAIASNPKLAQLTRALGEMFPPAVTVVEVRGHKGHPWNDLADGLARHVANDGLPLGGVSCPSLHELATTDPDRAWLWLQRYPGLDDVFPPSFGRQLWQVCPSTRKLPSVPMPFVDPTVGSCSSKLVTVGFRMASINVLSLDDPSSQSTRRRARSGHTARIDLQCHQAGLAVVGLQETRTPSGQTRADHYLVFASGSDTQHTALFGCELWVHRKLALVTLPSGASLAAQDFTFVVLHADPRRLCVAATASTVSLLFIVLHAPCMSPSSSDEDLHRWWTSTVALAQQWGGGDWKFAFLDANAPLANSIEGL
eukprot:Skav210832  [mRNA]  locus=scaffold6695:3819:5322:- [translate_table: standard]